MKELTLTALDDMRQVLESLGDHFLTVELLPGGKFAQIAARVTRYNGAPACVPVIVAAYGDGVVTVSTVDEEKTFDRHGCQDFDRCAEFIARILEND